MKKALSFVFVALIFMASFSLETPANKDSSTKENSLDQLMKGNESEESEDTGFDLSVLEEMEGYSYDIFEKAWVIDRSYIKEYSDGAVIISIYCSGNDSGVTAGPSIVAQIIKTNGENDGSEENQRSKYAITGIAIALDGDIYSWPNAYPRGDEGHAIVLEKDKEFLERFGNTDPENIVIRLYTAESHLDFDQSDWNSSFDDLQEGCRVLYEYDPWKYSLLYDETVSFLESEYPMEYEPAEE